MTMTTKLIFLMLAVAALALAGGAYYYWRTVLSAGELGQKNAYSVLQRIEYGERSAERGQEPMIVRDAQTNLVLLGLPASGSKYPRAWIILNQVKPGGDVYILPEELTVSVRCAYVSKILTEEHVEIPVQQYLRKICAA